MRELSALREGWDAVEAEEMRLLQSMTVQESAHQWLALQRAFEPQLQQTAVLVAPERQAALAQLQLRPSSFDTRHPLPANLRATPLR